MEVSTKLHAMISPKRSTFLLLGIMPIIVICLFLEPVSTLSFPHLDAFDAVSTEDVRIEISEHFLPSNRARRSSSLFPEKIKLQIRSKRFSPIITLQKKIDARPWFPIRYHNNDTFLNEYNDESEPYQAYIDKIYDASALVTRSNGQLEVMMEFFIGGRQFFVVTKYDPSNTEDIIHTLLEPINLLSPGNDYKLADEGQASEKEHERLKRETSSVSAVNKIELLIFVDFSLYKFWKELVPVNGTNRDQVVIKMIEQYYAFMGTAVNLRYQNINDTNLNIQVEVVGIIIAQSEADSPWMEKNKNGMTGNRANVDAETALVHFGNYIKENRNSLIGHDHAVLLTRYDLLLKGNPFAAGYAFLSTLCRNNSVSVVEDHFNFVSLTVIAHEIGHSLSATHDGFGVNTCNGNVGYIMANINSPDTGPTAYNQWLFSTCSRAEFRNYTQNLDQTGSNCMKRIDAVNHSNYTMVMPGTQYTADEQCIIMRDEQDSYMCRAQKQIAVCTWNYDSQIQRMNPIYALSFGVTKGVKATGYAATTSYIVYDGGFNYSSICTGMLCKVSKDSTCELALPADGTPCGPRKWCINGRCMQSASVPATCIHGDQVNKVHNGMGCSALVLPTRSACINSDVRELCCMSCQICLAGSYQPSVSSALCRPCPAGSYQTMSNSTSCIPCKPGTYQNQTGSSSPCSPCQAGTYQNLTGQASCVSCPVGYYQLNESSSTCVACIAGWYQPSPQASSCIQCEVGSYQSLMGQGSCIICPPGKTTDRNGSTSVDKCYPVCSAGSYRPPETSQCMPCTAGKYQPATGQPSCLPCLPGKYQNLTGQTSCKYCTAGTYQTSSGSASCIPCNPGYYQPNESSQVCIACSAGWYQPYAGASSCNQCEIGSYQNLQGQDSCIKCPTGTTTDTTGSTSADNCYSGVRFVGMLKINRDYKATYGNKSSTDFKNLEQELTTELNNACRNGSLKSFCKYSKLTNTRNGSIVAETELGYLSNPVVTENSVTSSLTQALSQSTGSIAQAINTSSIAFNQLSVCPAGSYRSPAISECVPCTAGKYQPEAGQTSCLPCQPGTYQNLAGQTSCKSCTAGSYQTSSGSESCIPCNPGTYKNQTDSSFVCRPCQAGTYQRVSGQASCDQCTVGYYQPNESSQVCIACSAGWYQPYTGASSCNRCEIGSYQNLQGQGSCIKCPTGTTTDTTGSTSADNCYSVVRFIGTLKINRVYKATYGNKSSTDFKNLEQELTTELNNACRNGSLKSFCKYSKLTNTRNGSIVAETELGYLSNPVVTENSVTSSLTQALSQSTGSIAQAINTSSIAFNQLSVCPAGSYRSPAISECVPCTAGKYQPEAGQTSCLPCQPGTYQNLAGQTSCKSCTAGSYQTSSGSESCIPCNPGTYKNQTDSSFVCRPCQAGTYQRVSGQASCDQCTVGYYQPNESSQVCIACSAGWYQPYTGASSCNQCEIGSYQNLQGQGSCIKCPTGATTDTTGSTSADNCYSDPTITASTTKAPTSPPTLAPGNEKSLPEWVIPVAAGVGGALVLGIVIAMCCCCCRETKQTTEDTDYHHAQSNKKYASSLYEKRYIKGKPEIEQHKEKKSSDANGIRPRRDERSRRRSNDEKYSSSFGNHDPYSAPHNGRHNRHKSHSNHHSRRHGKDSEGLFYISGKKAHIYTDIVDNENDYRQHSHESPSNHQSRRHGKYSEAPFYISGKNENIYTSMADNENDYRQHSSRYHKKHQGHGHRHENGYGW